MSQDSTYRLIVFCRDTYQALLENAQGFLETFTEPVYTLEIQGTTFELSFFELMFGQLMVTLLIWIVIAFVTTIASWIPKPKIS